MKKLWIIIHLIAAIIPLYRITHSTETQTVPFPGWPETIEGRPIQELPLTDREKTWHENFPGRIGRFTDGEHEIIIRWTVRPTRKLHLAESCLKGSGYVVQPQGLVEDRQGSYWSRHLAQQKGKQTLEIRERISDEQGNSWSDVSSWFWAAMLKKSQGPWWAVTISRPISRVTN